jgi:hypothetical protein
MVVFLHSGSSVLCLLLCVWMELWWFCSAWQPAKLSAHTPTVLHPQALGLWRPLISQVLPRSWKPWYVETLVQLTCTETTQGSGRYNLMTLTTPLESLPTVCHVQIEFSSRWHALSLPQTWSHIIDLFYTNVINLWSSVNNQLHAHFTYRLLSYVKARHGPEHRAVCHQQVNPIFWSPCFSMYLRRAFSIRRALRSLKDSIRSWAERANDAADVSKHEPCRKIIWNDNWLHQWKKVSYLCAYKWHFSLFYGSKLHAIVTCMPWSRCCLVACKP